MLIQPKTMKTTTVIHIEMRSKSLYMGLTVVQYVRGFIARNSPGCSYEND